MGTQPWYKGQTVPALQITLTLDSGPEDLTGLVAGNLAMTIRTNTDTAGTGTFAILSTKPAVVTYQFSSGDVTTPGVYQLIVKATFPSGLKIYDPIGFTITDI